MPLNKHKAAIIALVIANIIWGAASPIFKMALSNIPLFTLAFIRFYGAAIVIIPFCYKKLKIEKPDWKDVILMSLFGVTINIIFFFLGLKYAPSVNAPIIASSGPIFGYILSIYIFKEKPRKKILAGTFISLLGVLAIVGEPLFSLSLRDSQTMLGNFFFILATIGAVGHGIFSKKVVDKYPASTLTFWSFLIGSITFLPFFMIESRSFNLVTNIDFKGFFGLTFGIFLSSALAYLLFEWGIKKIKAQEMGIFAYIDPIAAIIIAIPLLGESISLVFMLGSILVFGGIFIAEGRINYHPFKKMWERTPQISISSLAKPTKI